MSSIIKNKNMIKRLHRVYYRENEKKLFALSFHQEVRNYMEFIYDASSMVAFNPSCSSRRLWRRITASRFFSS